jgi:hypothetical protein
MPWWNAALARAERAARGLLVPPPRVASLPAEPVDSDLGAFGVRAGPGAGPAPSGTERLEGRHGWFPSQVGSGDAEAATRRLVAWLRSDVPGTGPAWEHASDLAIRLLNWHVGLAWLPEVPGELRRGLAGSAGWHLDHLHARAGAGGHRRLLAAAGRVVGGLTFPGLKDARAHWTEGLGELARALDEIVAEDGADPELAPAWMAQSLWAVALARGVVLANGVGLPSAIEPLFARGAHFLERLAGGVGKLPALGEPLLAEDLVPCARPLAWSLGGLARAWGPPGGEGAPGEATDPRLHWLGASSNAAVPPEPRSWGLWSWRASGVVVAETRVRGEPSRVVATFGRQGRGGPLTHVAPMHLVWDLASGAVLADPGVGVHNGLTLEGFPPAGAPALDVSRVDGRKARIEASATMGRASWRRELLLNQARLVAEDRVSPGDGGANVRMSWQLGAGWEVAGTGPEFTARRGAMSLVVQLPPGLSWERVEGTDAGRRATALRGFGGVGASVRLMSSFEIK